MATRTAAMTAWMGVEKWKSVSVSASPFAAGTRVELDIVLASWPWFGEMSY